MNQLTFSEMEFFNRKKNSLMSRKKSRIEFEVNKRPSSFKKTDDFKGLNWNKKMEHEKSAVRCKVEHPFRIVKKQMGYSKVVYCGIAKNA